MGDLINLLLGLFGIQQPSQPLVSPQPTQQIQSIDPLEQMISQGLAKYPGGAPIATLSAQLAKSGRQIQKAGGDPLLPTVISLKESQGGKKQVGINNPYGLRGTQNGSQQFINYATPEEALFGGTIAHPLGFMGNLFKNYQPYLKSGNLADFFSTYTPISDSRNPSIQNQIDLYNQLRSYF